MKGAQGLFILFTIEGLIALLATLLSRSEDEHAVFLWLSLGRVLLVVLILALWIGILTVALILWRSPHRLEPFLAKLDEWCLGAKQLGPLLIVLVFVPLLISAAALKVLSIPLEYSAYQHLAPDTFPLLHALLAGILPFLLFVLLMMVEAGIYLAVRHWPAVHQPETWAWAHIGPWLLLILVVLVTLSHWIILAFQLRVFVNIPAWYWIFEPISFSARDLGFALGALGLLALCFWVLIYMRRLLLGLVLLFLSGLYLQLGVGIMTGAGFATIHERYFSTYHEAYVVKASQSRLGIVDSVRQYEQLYRSNSFTTTKPPGLMVFYIGLDHLVNGFPSAFSDNMRFERLSQFVVYGFPLVAILMPLLLYAFTRYLLPDSPALVHGLAPLSYILAPNVVLFSLFPDQALYPAAFLLCVWFTVLVIRRQSLIGCFLAGVLLYAAVFFAFTMLPLYPFAGLYLVLHYWRERSRQRWQHSLWMALAIAAGTLIMYVLFRILLNYDFFPRFEWTVAINHNFDFYRRVGLQPPSSPESFPTRLAQIGNAAWVNNLDFAAAIGFPIYILFFIQGIRLIRRFFQGIAGSGDAILISLLISFIVLNLAGTAQGEVPRLWIFWLPIVVILASLELEPYARRHPGLLLLLALAQLVTIMLTFHFQDLRMGHLKT